MNGVYYKRSYMRVSDLIRALAQATYHLASRQSNGQGHGEMCIFQQYGQVSEARQRRRRQDALRRLERELDGKHTISRIFCTYSQVRVYEGYPKWRH